MEKIAKSKWIWALVALGIAAFVVSRPGDLPVEDKTIDATVVVEPSVEVPAEILAATSAATPEMALADTASSVAAEGQAEVTTEPPVIVTEAQIEQTAAPDVAAESTAVSNIASTSTADVPREPAPVAALDADTPSEFDAPILAAESPRPAAVSPAVASEPQPEPTLPEGEAVIAQPDPNLPALELGAPLQGVAQETEFAVASAPAPEVQPLYIAASQPLSLAQVLPPGEAPVPGQISPSFDLVRVSPDGSAVIAGRAAPGATVQVFSGTNPVAEVTASARGEFVVFLDAPGNTTLDQNIPAMPEGASLVVSQEDIVILPAAPDAVDATPIVVRRTPDAVHIMQPSTPAIPGNISLDLVSYTDSGAVQLAGRGQPGNIARIYTNGVLAGESNIAQGGAWALEISDIAEGRYVLRIDEISPSGDVRSRTESPFQRQFPEADMPNTFSQGAKIIVQPGNTLWLMATEAYGNGDAYSQIFTANKAAIRDPDLIYPGQIFSIPRAAE
ncbi:MAG: LysM peptidoglycan-binding domain-containing protein [Rhodobacteraceae bacterium]|nr:LysM peptidoglycan-binding domain-containing protein [Paracoccaceae bacterium]